MKLKALLKKYTSAEQCGAWNSTILEELKADIEFGKISFLLHEQAADSGLECTTALDFNVILNIEIEYRKRLTVLFELSFLSPQYFVSPAFLTITLDEKNSEFGLAEYGCGKLNKDGDWCIANSKNCLIPDKRSGWAVLYASRFGSRGLRERIRKR